MAIGPVLADLLRRYGLSSLTQWASDMLTIGASEAEILISLYDRPEFNARFPAIKARETGGLPPISVDEYLSFETSVNELSGLWGIPLSKKEVDDFLIKNVSAREVEERFNIAGTAIYEAPIEDRQAMMELYNIDEGRLAKYWMDPTKELAALQREYVSSRTAGAAIRSGYGSITRTQAERLTESGLGFEQAGQAFSDLFSMRNLFEAIDEVEQDISQEQQIEMLAGDTEVAKQVESRAEKRLAEFQGGGEFAAGQEGFKGTGAATS